MSRPMFLLLAILIPVQVIRAADFSLTIGNPMAAGTATKVKGGLLAVRLEGCENLAKSQITGTAEGVVNGARKSVPVQLTAVTPGVSIVSRDWETGGAWVVNLKATCADAKTGALVPIGSAGFIRESVKSFPRYATTAEVEASLKALLERNLKEGTK